MERRENAVEMRPSGTWQLAAASALGAAAFALLCAFAALMLAAVLAPAQAYAATSQDMYRLYNPNSGEHFYTASSFEASNLADAGWNYEGVGWVAPTSSNTPVYRLYNPNPGPNGSGEHHYTMSAVERDSLIALGWKDEGIGWYSDDAKTVPLYRQYNPNEFNCNHNYTTSKAENDSLVSLGWKDEGVAWYAVEEGKSTNATSYSLYLQKCQEYVNKYGTSSTTYEMTGFAFAKLVDFNKDGADELVTAYYKDTTSVGADGYVVEVWGSKSPTSIERLCSGVPFISHGRSWSIIFSGGSDASYLLSGFNSSVGTSHYGYDVYGFSGGSFGLVHSLEHRSTDISGDSWQTIDGTSVDSATFNSLLSGYTNNIKTYVLSSKSFGDALSSNKAITSEVKNSVSQTMATLRAGA